ARSDVLQEAHMSTESQQEIAAALLHLGSATLGESGGLATDRRLKPAWSGAVLAAPAYPVGCTPGDNLAVHVAVTTAPRGSVLVSAGDWVVGDVDGVTVVPRDALSDVMGAGRAHEAKETGFFAELKAGQTTVQLL